jgi:hypothetical protein
MAIQWKAKTAAEVVAREWAVPVPDGDSVASFLVSMTGAVLDSSERNGDLITVRLSGGADGDTAIAELSATTNQGRVIEGKAYLPIRALPNAFSYRIGQVLNYALRPIVGLSATATADELEDARENLDDMLASWAAQGADLAVKLPGDVNDILYVPDYAIPAIKAALRVRLCGLYAMPVDIEDFKAAQRGLQQVKMALLPVERDNEYY